MRNGKYTLIIAPKEYPGKRYRGRYAYEHHIVWWREHGRLPRRGFVIHHKNEDTRDNAIANLEEKGRLRHIREHALAHKVAPVGATCGWCLAPFTISRRKLKERSAVNANGNVYCSRSHSTKAQMSRLARSHGTRSTYGSGCRCSACRAAHADYMRAYKRRNKADKPPEPGGT